MSTTTDLTTLKINYLTQAQYDAAAQGGTIEEDELYLTPDRDMVSDVKVDGTSVVTDGVAEIDLSGKQDKLLVEGKVIKDNYTVAKSNVKYDTVSVAKTGYTPIGIVGMRIENATQSGTMNTYCVLHSFELQPSGVFFLIRNTNTTTDAVIKITAYILYVKN